MTTKEIANVLTNEQLAELRENFPQETSFNRIMLPRLGLVSQDVTEGRGKAMKVTAEAGMFFTEHETDELDENGKKIWKREEIGKELEAIIFFSRNQLKFYDEATEKYTSSPVYDDPNEVVPLFCEKQEVARGTVAELKKKYEYTDKDGKIKSRLEDNRVLYVWYKDEAYQLNLRGSSMYAFQKYARVTLPPSVITKFSSEPRTKGDVEWNQMTFVPVRPLTVEETDNILKMIKETKSFIQAEKQFYGKKEEVKGDIDKELDELAGK